MFAVPGWSVSADTLRVQVEPKDAKSPNASKSVEINGADKKSRKRKRGHGLSKGVEVTEENLGRLWRKHMEEKSVDHVAEELEGETREQKKKMKRPEKETNENTEADEDTFKNFSEGDATSELKEESLTKRKEKKKRKKKKEKMSLEVRINRQGNAGNAGNYIPNLENDVQNLADGKAKYEQRKAEVAKKRERKALLQANGTLPPTRLGPTTTTTTNATTSISSKPSKAPGPSTPLDGHRIAHPLEATVPREATFPAEPPQTSVPVKSTDSKLSTTNLTPLQQRMAAKLTSARFRHLNQTLYTSPSDQAMRLFTDSPQAYTSYHAGFRAQVAIWPQNPIDGFIEDVKIRGSISVPSQKKMWREQKHGKKGKEQTREEVTTNGDSLGKVDALPRTKGVCTICDLGCGDAHLAASLDPMRKSLNLNLLSFDLAKGDTPNTHLITVADISNLTSVGAQDGSVNIAICCLSLMGTNWVSVVDECSRIVRAGGEVWVAEIKSRFTRPEQAKKKAGDGIGKKKKKKQGEADDEEDESVPLEELEDAKGPKDETDVSAFVEVIRKRGFTLKGEPDMANKMFVRMRFVKALRLENEKGGTAKFGEGFRGKQQKMKFVEDGSGEVDESKVLKPCVYKTR